MKEDNQDAREMNIDCGAVKAVVRHTVRTRGISRAYRFLHVTDVHSASSYESESEMIRAEADLRGGKYFPPECGLTATDRLPLFFRLAENLNADGIIMTGDILDFPSAANIDALLAAMSGSDVPAYYCLGNHEWSFLTDYHCKEHEENNIPKYFPLVNFGKNVARIKELPPSVHYLAADAGDVIVFAVDNSKDQIDPEALQAAEVIFSGEKPVLVACHVPFYSETLVKDTVDYWKRIILLGKGGIDPDPVSRRFMELMTRPGSPVFAVVAGHIHFAHEDLISDNIVQFVSPEGHAGKCGLIEILPEE